MACITVSVILVCCLFGILSISGLDLSVWRQEGDGSDLTAPPKGGLFMSKEGLKNPCHQPGSV